MSIRSASSTPMAGFTLTEMMVALALVATLATLVAPSMATFVTSRQVEDAARRLADDMALGRNESVKRNAAVLLCVDAGVTDGRCDAASATTDWARGWRVCFDVNGDGTCDAGSVGDPNPIRLQPPINAAVSLEGPLSMLRFNPDGTVTASAYTSFEVRGATGTAPRWLVRFAASGAMSARKG